MKEMGVKKNGVRGGDRVNGDVEYWGSWESDVLRPKGLEGLSICIGDEHLRCRLEGVR